MRSVAEVVEQVVGEIADVCETAAEAATSPKEVKIMSEEKKTRKPRKQEVAELTAVQLFPTEAEIQAARKEGPLALFRLAAFYADSIEFLYPVNPEQTVMVKRRVFPYRFPLTQDGRQFVRGFDTNARNGKGAARGDRSWYRNFEIDLAVKLHYAPAQLDDLDQIASLPEKIQRVWRPLVALAGNRKLSREAKIYFPNGNRRDRDSVWKASPQATNNPASNYDGDWEMAPCLTAISCPKREVIYTD